MVGVVLASMVGIVFMNVVLRYVLNSGLTWAEEAARILFVWLIFLGAVMASRANAHLSVDMLLDRLPPLGQRLLGILTRAIFIGVLVLLLTGLFELWKLNSGVPTPGLGIPRNTLYLAGVISALCMIAIMAVDIVIPPKKVSESEQAVYNARDNQDTGAGTADQDFVTPEQDAQYDEEQRGPKTGPSPENTNNVRPAPEGDDR